MAKRSCILRELEIHIFIRTDCFINLSEYREERTMNKTHFYSNIPVTKVSLMSLFPAYIPNTSNSAGNEDLSANKILQSKSEKETSDLSWLQNSSFIPVNDNLNVEKNENNGRRSLICDSVEEVTTAIKKKKKKKKDEKKKMSRLETKPEARRSSASKILDSDPFYEDKKQERGNFLVTTLHRPAIPRYSKDNRFFKDYKYLMNKYKGNKKKVKRYFILTSRLKESAEVYENDQSVKEEELTRVTEDFNKKLASNPSDVDVWLEYIRFQDTVYDFEKAYRKNPVGGDKVTNERKLAILEKALSSNPSSEQLLKEKLTICERIWPADQLANECTRALAQDPGNLMLWRSLVHTTRNSMARCTVPGVQQLYTKAMSRINQLRLHRAAITVEQDILALLLECGTFLQQTGLWEQLWTLLQMYLSLSLTASGQFDVPFPIDDNKLREQEDGVVASGLPLSVLWLRIEQLRAAVHFLPDPNCDSDPQRVVFTDDMAGLVQPVMSPELKLPLVVITGVLLKVPLLPSRQCLLSTVTLLQSPFSTNNVETLLPAVMVNGPHCRWLLGAVDLISEPQYVRSECYLNWVLKILQHCAGFLSLSESVIIQCWILRLYGMLCRLLSRGFTSVPPTVSKQARGHAKQLLKSPQYRDNLVLFTEYALMERDSGDVVKACKVLETAAVMAPPAAEPSVDYIYLCRKLVECLILRDHITEKDHAVSVLVALGDHKPLPSAAAAVSDVAIRRSLTQWQQRTTALVASCLPQAKEALTMSKLAVVMTPSLLVEWLSCHALLLSLSTSIWDATAHLQQHINLIPHIPGTLGGYWVEQLYEILSDILYSHCLRTATGFTLLRDTLVTALAKFPNNLFLLGTLASIEANEGGGGSPLWKLVSYFPPCSALARLVLVFVVRHRISLHQDKDVKENSPYLHNLLGHLTEHAVTGQCPLVWRLYIQLMAAYNISPKVKKAFYQCVSTCPWVKAFYVDAVKFLPEDMSEILDLLIEKELRLHTTPEELDILRD